MKIIINVLCVIISVIFIIIGLLMIGFSDVVYIQYINLKAAQMLTGGILILSGSLGLLLQVYIYNK